MTLLEKLGIPCLTVRIYDATGRWAEVRNYSRGCSDDRHVDVNRLALEVLTLDAMRLGRPRARSGAEEVLKRAGFTEPSRQYCFAMDYNIRAKRSAEASS